MRVVLCLTFLLAGWCFSQETPTEPLHPTETLSTAADSNGIDTLFAGLPIKERAVHAARMRLYNALKQDDLEREPDEILKLTEPGNPNKSIITDYERLQIYLFIEKYDLAVDLWVNKYIDDEPSVTIFPTTKNYLGEYLNKVIDIRTNDVLVQIIHQIEASDISQEQKELARILACLPRSYSRNRIRDATIGVPDKESYEESLKSLENFENKHPYSQYIPQIRQIKSTIQRRYETLTANPATKKLYTGGLGIEVFYSTPGKIFLSIPIQVKRIIFTMTFLEKKFGTIGFVAYDSERFKIHPFVGLGEHDSDKKTFTKYAGAQADWRFYLGKPDSEFHTQDYLALKIKYAAEWDGKEGFQNHFMIGLGAHIW